MGFPGPSQDARLFPPKVVEEDVVFVLGFGMVMAQAFQKPISD